jgi:hypothetical protein
MDYTHFLSFEFFVVQLEAFYEGHLFKILLVLFVNVNFISTNFLKDI